jgi:hypothetical protein
MGLERAIIPPHERPIEPAAGLSSEEVKWSPDGRYVIGGELFLHAFLAPFRLTDDSIRL